MNTSSPHPSAPASAPEPGAPQPEVAPAADSPDRSDESAICESPATAAVWFHRPYADDPRVLIPLKPSLDRPLQPPTGASPAQREVAAASAEFVLGLYAQAHARLLSVDFADLMPADAWQTTDLLARLHCAVGDWRYAASILAQQWRRLMVGLENPNEYPPSRRNNFAAVILGAEGDHATAAQVTAMMIAWGGCFCDHYQFACALSRLGLPVDALEVLLWKAEERQFAGLALYDPDFEPMWTALATSSQSRSTRRLLSVLFGPNGERAPEPLPAMGTVDVATFRAMPRHFAPLFNFDPIQVLYQTDANAVARHPRLTSAYRQYYENVVRHNRARLSGLFQQRERDHRASLSLASKPNQFTSTKPLCCYHQPEPDPNHCFLSGPDEG